MSMTADAIRALPKVSLHDHLDGGLRPATMIELAAEVGHELPRTDPEELRLWFAEAADSGSLERYLETFDHTVAVMQTAESLRRVAREFVEDNAADGVVVAEARWAPEQHLQRGLSPDDTVEAVRDGLAEGMAACHEQGHTIVATQLVTAMRHADRSVEIAELAVRWRDESVAGFDIAGAEIGFPPTNHRDAFDLLRRNNMRFTIHAGEAVGPESVQLALAECGAHRIGHGVRLLEDLTVGGQPATASSDPWSVELGRLAAYVRDAGIPLELCPSSNVQTGAVPSVAEHPIELFHRLGFTVTVNTDNRLMSNTTLTDEFGLLVELFDWTEDDIRQVTRHALRNAFLPLPQRVELAEQFGL
ncbi:MAG: adenosine deaminase [Propionibacterium sp.]|nr:adenosine deaminase [Propionibacterium sp.]